MQHPSQLSPQDRTPDLTGGPVKSGVLIVRWRWDLNSKIAICVLRRPAHTLPFQ